VGRGPNLVGRGSRKIQTLSQGDWSSPDQGTLLDPRRADLSDIASVSLGVFSVKGVATSEPWCCGWPRLRLRPGLQAVAGAFRGVKVGPGQVWTYLFCQGALALLSEETVVNLIAVYEVPYDFSFGIYA
jgi:hypothetical protein